MAKISYRERVKLDRVQLTREMLREMPMACTDFINSLAMTTSTLTRLAYVLDLRTFFDFTQKELPKFSERPLLSWTDQDFASITTRDLVAYSEYLTLYYKEMNTEAGKDQIILQNHEYGVMRKLSSLRSFFRFLFKAERIPGNTASLVTLPKVHEKPILFLAGAEIEKLLDTAANGTDFGSQRQKNYQKNTRSRDYAILMLFLGTGMRLSECVGIDFQDLDLENHAVLVTRKGGNQVVLYYPEDVREALETYLEDRKEIVTADPEDADAVFLSLQRRRISQRAVEIMVKKYCAIAAPLKKRLSPHKLRSTYATRLYQQTGDIYLVADALGHADVNTTRRHYAAMSDAHRREAAENITIPQKEKETETIIDPDKK